MRRRKVKLHLGSEDPQIDIRLSGPSRQQDPDEDPVGIALGVVAIFVLLAWLLA
jgi:hypothetical protein